jgi:hypothetical protein
MRYTYFDYLVENHKLYRQTTTVSLFLVFLSSIILLITSLNPKPNKDLSQSKLILGEVQDIKQIELKSKGQALFDFNKEVDTKVLLLKVENIEFIIEGQTYIDYYNKFISVIKQGDFVKVYYFIDFENDKIIQQIENSDEILIPIAYAQQRFFEIKVAFLISFSFFLLVVMILYLKRRRYLKT